MAWGTINKNNKSNLLGIIINLVIIEAFLYVQLVKNNGNNNAFLSNGKNDSTRSTSFHEFFSLGKYDQANIMQKLVIIFSISYVYIVNINSTNVA